MCSWLSSMNRTASHYLVKIICPEKLEFPSYSILVLVNSFYRSTFYYNIYAPVFASTIMDVEKIKLLYKYEPAMCPSSKQWPTAFWAESGRVDWGR